MQLFFTTRKFYTSGMIALILTIDKAKIRELKDFFCCLCKTNNRESTINDSKLSIQIENDIELLP